MGVLERLKFELKSTTIEPAMFFFVFSFKIDHGAQITTNFLLWKICHLGLNYSTDICSNLTLDEYESYNTEVQKSVVDIQSISIYLGSIPAIIYSLFAGSLSDDFGRKPLIVIPLFGAVLTAIGMLINCLFIENLPVQFFHIDRLWQFFGGMSVFYLGSYGYIATYTKVEERSYMLTRCNGIESIGNLLGKSFTQIQSTWI